MEEFRREAFKLFEGLLIKIKNDFVTFLNNLEIVSTDQTTVQKTQKTKKIESDPKCLLVIQKNKKISRNEKCPSTGKKFKHCCGAL